jgi:hypothetical protein
MSTVEKNLPSLPLPERRERVACIQMMNFIDPNCLITSPLLKIWLSTHSSFKIWLAVTNLVWQYRSNASNIAKNMRKEQQQMSKNLSSRTLEETFLLKSTILLVLAAVQPAQSISLWAAEVSDP